ncbi:MAG: gluconate 2-dehydrogenase subunit 3 family protein [Blastocatellia bacterium]|nr:gluconate 2-dehydrogenase subunit 3 family protein [Blastocatellia bacterium]
MMKRRRFVQTLAAAPAAALPATGELRAAQPGGAEARQARQAEDAPKLEVVVADAAAAGVARFFTAPQFAALRRLSEILMPPLKGMPGALEAEAPEFLDFLIGASPAERQQIYRIGLDALNAQAMRRYKKPFAEVDEAQAVALLAPLRQPWTYNPPADPLARFLRDAKQDVRAATMNSRVYVAAGSTGGRRGGGMGQYWLPID